MSNIEVKESENNALQEVSNKVAITPEDCSGAADFWTHFEVPMPQELRNAFAEFAKDPSFKNQCAVKLQVCKAIGYTEHEAFTDEMFKEIVEECRSVTYDMGFDQSLENTLTTEDKK
jgi:hypothetical protein